MGITNTIGFGIAYSATPWAIFTTDSTGNVFSASSNPGGSQTLTPSSNYLGVSHRYRIEWNAGSIVYYVDGTQVASHTGTTSREYASNAGGTWRIGWKTIIVNWLRMGPYSLNGTFVSRVFDAGQTVRWTDLSHTATIPTGTTLTFETRTSLDGIDWSAWQAVNSPIASPDGRYLQYQVTFTSDNTGTTPTLENVTITYSNAPTAVVVSSFTGSSHMGTAQLDWVTANEMGLVGFNLYRAETLDGAKHKLNANLIPAEHPGQMIRGELPVHRCGRAGQALLLLAGAGHEPRD